MSHGTVAAPFDSGEVAAIDLNSPPLALVLAQFRFPSVLAVASERVGADFHDLLHEQYPEGHAEQEVALNVGPGVAPVAQTSTIWRLVDESARYRVSLGASFIAVETSAYDGHERFFERVREAVTACAKLVRPVRVERIGVRYVARLENHPDLAQLIRPEFLGVLGEPSTEHASVAISQGLWTLSDETVLAGRWGRLPGGATLDPTLAPAAEQSWSLDIDVYDERARDFQPNLLLDRAFTQSRHAYRFFRWAVEPAFLRQFGGDETEIRRALTREGLL